MTKVLSRLTSAFLACAMVLTLTMGLCTNAYAAEKVDQSLYVPSIYSYEYSPWSQDAPYAMLGLLCPGDEFGTAYTGFQAYISLSPDFSNPRVISSSSEWNGLGYAHLSVLGSWAYQNLLGGQTYYVKVRSYKNIDGTTSPNDSSTYGPWSAVTTIDIPYYSRHLAQDPKYTYELYVLSPASTTIYDGCTVPIYVKTDNPDPSSFDFVTDAEMWGTTSAASSYPDIDFTDEYIYTQADKIRVEGGYIWIFNTEDSGTLEFEVREYQKDGYVIADKFNLTVGDYAKARDAWMDSIIAQATTSSMDSFEKMQAISDYLLPRFKYLTNDGNGHLLTLASQPNSPYFVTNRWDSAISPSALCQFAERIGGFTKIDNLYSHYADYGYSWANGHWLCYCSDGDREAFYEACPLSPTGAVTYSTIDLSNPRNLHKINGIQKLAYENPKPSEPSEPTTPTTPDPDKPANPSNPGTTPDPDQPANPSTPDNSGGEDEDVATQEMFRLYNPNSGEHFYTSSTFERDHLIDVGWNDEGTGWVAPTEGDPVYRLYNQYAGEHHYTTSAAERDMLVSIGWNDEGVGWCTGGESPLYRLYNPNEFANNHHYSTSAFERDHLLGIGWRDEGIAWYGVR